MTRSIRARKCAFTYDLLTWQDYHTTNLCGSAGAKHLSHRHGISLPHAHVIAAMLGCEGGDE